MSPFVPAAFRGGIDFTESLRPVSHGRYVSKDIYIYIFPKYIKWRGKFEDRMLAIANARRTAEQLKEGQIADRITLYIGFQTILYAQITNLFSAFKNCAAL